MIVIWSLLAGLGHGGVGTQCRRIVDGEDAHQIGMRLQHVGGHGIAVVPIALARQFGHDLQFAVVLLQVVHEAVATLHGGGDFRIGDDGDLPLSPVTFIMLSPARSPP